MKLLKIVLLSVVAISVINAFGKPQEEAKLAPVIPATEPAKTQEETKLVPVIPTKGAETIKTHRAADVSVKPFEFKPRQVTGQEIITGICALSDGISVDEMGACGNGGMKLLASGSSPMEIAYHVSGYIQSITGVDRTITTRKALDDLVELQRQEQLAEYNARKAQKDMQRETQKNVQKGISISEDGTPCPNGQTCDLD